LTSVSSRKGRIKMRLTDLLALSHVPRWSIVPHIRPQSVAEHSYRVWAIADLLMDLIQYNGDRGEVAKWALMHDAPESRSGDIPGVFKHGIEEAIRVREHEVCEWFEDDKCGVSTTALIIVKVADLIETFTFIRMYGTGNHARLTANAVLDQLKNMSKVLDGYCYTPAPANSWYHVSVICDTIINELGREPAKS
jgi:5'-deoxynucleotidase YfbR-like HD superfamily hydrolase